MPTKKQRSSGKKLNLYTKLFFRAYPALPYIGKWLCLCGLVGLLVGSASAGFLVSLDWVTGFRENHVWLITLLPLAGLLIGLLYHYQGKSVEAGNNLLLATVHEPGATIPFRMAPFVYIGTLMTHLFGGSAGREGTALQMAGALTDPFSKVFHLSSSDRQILLISAIAAGFGSVFGTPLAGALFAIEVLMIGKLRYEAIFPAFLAAILADQVTRLWQVGHTHYHIPFIPELSLLHIFYAILAGIIFGCCAAAFSKAMHYTGSIFRSRISYPPLRPFAGGILVALAVWGLGTTKYIGLGIPTILQSFEQSLPAYDFAFKMGLTILTLASGFKGGEVTPLFFIGATLGNALGYFLPLPPGLIAGMGFVAVFAGATNTPIACSIMALELFGSECGVYAAIACVVSYLFSGHNSIYGQQMVGIPKHRRFWAYAGKYMKDL